VSRAGHSRKRLRQFWESRSRDAADAARCLTAWYKLARTATWDHFADLKSISRSIDQIGYCVVFDIGPQRYRVIARVKYGQGIVSILRVMDHKEYDKYRWVRGCRCDQPVPKPERSAATTPPAAAKAKPTPRKPKRRR
jgi:mRNA interferase HigB